MFCWWSIDNITGDGSAAAVVVFLLELGQVVYIKNKD